MSTVNSCDLDDVIKTYEIVQYPYMFEPYEDVDYIEEDNLDIFIKNNKHIYSLQKDFYILFNLHMFTDKNMRSYMYNCDSVWKQFNVDCPRTKIYVSNKQINNSEQFMRSLTSLHNYKFRIKSLTYKLTTVLAMLCNQSSYAFPMRFLQNLCALSCNSNYHITNMSSNRSVKITFTDNVITVIIETDFALFDISNNKIVSKIHCVLTINSLKTDNSLVKFAKNGIFSVTSG